MYGSRGSILHHYGWTWDYLLWGVKWHIVEKMMLDAPSYKYPKGKDKNNKEAKPQTKSSMRDFLNKKLNEQQ